MDLARLELPTHHGLQRAAPTWGSMNRPAGEVGAISRYSPSTRKVDPSAPIPTLDHLPPGRRSLFHSVTRYMPRWHRHFRVWLGSVIAWKTRSGGVFLLLSYFFFGRTFSLANSVSTNVFKLAKPAVQKTRYCSSHGYMIIVVKSFLKRINGRCGPYPGRRDARGCHRKVRDGRWKP
jgi:hypothetical protein